ncbi:MAG: hypothetical protein CBC04_05920 [Verrucomicrobia bacterium TMED44]|nr:MAG: hypothetical protein CBC04_05920 [Verrucomicrobia bacterium TMED44]
MQVIKLYLPMKDNDGNDLMYLHSLFIGDIADEDRITGFTRFQAEGFWFDGSTSYKDDVKIYEFHVANKDIGYVHGRLRRHAVTLCRQMKQECIYLQLNNETELVKGDK